MTTTPNLNLPQWEKTDRIMMDDFNDAMSKLDTAVKANADAMPRIVTGTYTGDGAATRTVSLGCSPKVVFICPENGGMSETGAKPYYYYGGLALQNQPAVLAIDRNDNRVYTMIEITDAGFCVSYVRDGANIYAATNCPNTVYHYIAIC